MTTNHKPTFESRRARDPYARGGSNIAFGGAAHRQLKYRKIAPDQSLSEHKDKLEELKRELREREQGDGFRIEKDGQLSIEEKKPETYSERMQRVLEETKDLDASDSDSDEESGSDSDSDSDSDEELMRELAKLKQEKLQKEKEEQARLELVTTTVDQEQPLKKSWRQSVLKSSKPQQQDKKSSEYINDMLKSQFHQRFMEKHVK